MRRTAAEAGGRGKSRDAARGSRHRHNEIRSGGTAATPALARSLSRFGSFVNLSLRTRSRAIGDPQFYFASVFTKNFPKRREVALGRGEV